MTEIKDHKTFWKRSTMEIITFTEGSLADIIQLARKDIISLITTIESQKSEIEGLHDALEMLPPKDVEIHERTQFQIDKTVDRLLIESLQKEKEMSSHRHALYAGELREQIESLKAITELAVKGLEWYAEHIDWEDDSMGDKARKALTEIERLQNAQT